MTTATKITLSRIALLPFILFFYLSANMAIDPFFFNYGKLIALMLFIVATVLYWLERDMVRKHNQISDVGKVMSPVATNLLVYMGFILVLTDWDVVGHVIPLWFGIIAFLLVIGRDLVVNALRQIARDKGVMMSAGGAGTVNRVLQFVVVGMLMFYGYNFVNDVIPLGIWYEIFEYATLYMLSAVSIVSIYSGVNYFIKYRESFASPVNTTKEKKSWEDKIDAKNEEES